VAERDDQRVGREAATSGVPEVVRVRRWLIVALLLAAGASAAFYGFALADSTRNEDAASALAWPRTYADPSIGAHPVRFAAAANAEPAATGMTRVLHLDASKPVYLVNDCDRGSMSIVVGNAALSSACDGTARLVGAFHFPARLRVAVTVTTSQRQPWGVAAYQ
jgi:hypothetical protein